MFILKVHSLKNLHGNWKMRMSLKNQLIQKENWTCGSMKYEKYVTARKNKKIWRVIMENRMDKKELIELIESLKLDKNEFWILSSGALVMRDLYPNAGDLDIAVTEKGLEELKKNYNLKQKANGWYIVNDKIECVLETKEDWKIEKWGNYNLQSIEMYYEFLKSSSREKDKARIPLVEEYMRRIQILTHNPDTNDLILDSENIIK